jgi:hypothetical protein
MTIKLKRFISLRTNIVVAFILGMTQSTTFDSGLPYRTLRSVGLDWIGPDPVHCDPDLARDTWHRICQFKTCGDISMCNHHSLRGDVHAATAHA